MAVSRASRPGDPGGGSYGVTGVHCVATCSLGVECEFAHVMVSDVLLGVGGTTGLLPGKANKSCKIRLDAHC